MAEVLTNIEELRGRIDGVDDQLLRLLRSISAEEAKLGLEIRAPAITTQTITKYRNNVFILEPPDIAFAGRLKLSPN